MRPLNDRLLAFRLADATPWIISVLMKLIAMRMVLMRRVCRCFAGFARPFAAAGGACTVPARGEARCLKSTEAVR